MAVFVGSPSVVMTSIFQWDKGNHTHIIIASRMTSCDELKLLSRLSDLRRLHMTPPYPYRLNLRPVPLVWRYRSVHLGKCTGIPIRRFRPQRIAFEVKADYPLSEREASGDALWIVTTSCFCPALCVTGDYSRSRLSHKVSRGTSAQPRICRRTGQLWSLRSARCAIGRTRSYL